MPPLFPQELSDLTIDHLYGDAASLSACALTCRTWLPSVRFHRFHNTALSCDSTQSFYDLLITSPDIRQFVQVLELHGQLGWPLESLAWQGSSYMFLSLLPTVLELRLVAVIIEESVHDMLVGQLQGVERLTMYRCRFRSFHSFVTLVGSFPSLDILSLSFALNWRFQFLLPTSVDENFRSHLPKGLRILRLGEPWSGEEDMRLSELVTVREMLLLEIHTKRTVYVVQRLLDVLGPDTLEVLEIEIEGTNGLQRILERDTFNLASCTRLRVCTLRVLIGKAYNEDVRWLAGLLSRLTSPMLESVTLSLYLHQSKDIQAIRRVSFDEMGSFDWTGIQERATQWPALRSLTVEGEGNPNILEGLIRKFLPELYARRVIQLVQCA